MHIPFNLYGSSCIFGIYFATLWDADSPTNLAVQWAGIKGVFIIIVVNVVSRWLTVNQKLTNRSLLSCDIVTYAGRTFRLWHVCVSCILEISLFLVMCQGINKRASSEQHIPSEYAYIPLLVGILLSTCCGKSLECYGTNSILEYSMNNLQFPNMLSFFLLVMVYPLNNYASDMSYPVDGFYAESIFFILMLLYAVPSEEIVCDNGKMTSAVIGKCMVFSVGVLCMNTGGK